MMKFVAIAGYAGSGKDSLFKILNKHFGYERVAFGDPVREMMLACDPIITHKEWISGTDMFGAHYGYEASESSYIRFSEYLEKVCDNNWDTAKKNPEVRAFMQRMATEGVRTIFGKDAWVKVAERKVNELRKSGIKKIAFTDLRFTEGEEEYCDHIQAFKIRVTREYEDQGAGRQHTSESYVDRLRPHIVIANSGTLEDLEDYVLNCATKIHQF